MTARGQPTSLATLTSQATSTSTALHGVEIKCTRGNTVLQFKISCWIAALVVRELLERGGWKIEEIK